MKILVTGAAGFIGYHLTKALAERGDEVVGIDNLNHYYDVSLKLGRLRSAGIPVEKLATEREKCPDKVSFLESNRYSSYCFSRIDITDEQAVYSLFEAVRPDVVCHLAAQAGVRYSIENPRTYINSNILGYFNVLDCSRMFGVKHFLYASSSSVYGLNKKIPYCESDCVEKPASIYAATKKSDELIAHSYSEIFKLPTTGLRFFTVYGPWGRPDMSPFLFTDAILRGKPIKVFNNGDMLRDFTYIDDIVEGVIRVIDKIAEPDTTWDAEHPNPATSSAPYRIYNIGNSQPIRLMDFIRAIEEACGREAEKIYLPMQPGDVYQTNADTTLLQKEFGYKPSKDIREGARETVEWYRKFYGL